MLQAVLFDFGGVILTSPFDAFTDYEREHGLPEGFIRSVNATNPDVNAWARLERNELSIEEFVPAFEAEARAAGHEVDATIILLGLRGRVRPEMVRAVERIRERGMRTALLTNNFVSEDQGFEQLLHLFDEVVESSRVGVRKPDPAFYELALGLLALPPEACVFLDDLGINLKPAAAMGMRTIKVVDPAVALGELAGLLGFSLD